MEKLGYSQAPFGLSNNLFDSVKEKLNEGLEELNKTADTIEGKTNDIVKANLPETKKVEAGENEGIGTKLKRKFNETSPAIVGGGTLLISKFAFKLGWLTSSILGAVAYVGKNHLDKNQGLSDSFEWSIMSENGKTPNGEQLYLNTKNARLYTITGIDQNGLPIFKQYYN